MKSKRSVMRIMDEYCEVVEEGLKERWEKLPIELYKSETFETIGALLSRQATLGKYMAISPSIWNPHIAPLIFRCMIDVHITLAWIIKDADKRAKQYILYGLGQVKLYIENLSALEKKNDEIHQTIKIYKNWLGNQRRDFLTEVNVGNWAGLNTRQMANECGLDDLYRFAYMPFSGAAHSMWHHVSVYNLRDCKNPLHKYHKVPKIFEPNSDLHSVYMSSRYLSETYDLVDKCYSLIIQAPMPLDYFLDAFGDEETADDDHN